MNLCRAAFAAQYLLLSCFAEGANNAVDCASPGEISTSDEATKVAKSCTTVDGNLIISLNASGEVELDGIETINGLLAVRSCAGTFMPYQGSSPCEDGSLTKLSSSTLKVIRGDIGIEAVETLKEVSFPVLQDAASIYINNLTALDTLDLEMLDTGRNLTVTEVPQLLYLNLGVSKGDRVIIAGNGSLVLALDNFSLRDNPRLEVLTISGVEEVRWISTNGQGTIGNLTVHDSKVDQLPLFFGNIESLEIRDNDELTDVLFPPDDIARKQIVSKMKNIAVSGNKKLNLTTIHDVNWNNVHDLSSWVWPMENMDTVVLDGIIHDAFFKPLLDSHLYTSVATANSSKPRVLENFQVTSSISTFHCEPLNELRRHDVFPGKYSCNGDSIDVASSSPRGTSPRPLYSFLGMVVGLCILL